jgi:hypothetical protein
MNTNVSLNEFKEHKWFPVMAHEVHTKSSEGI